MEICLVVSLSGSKDVSAPDEVKRERMGRTIFHIADKFNLTSHDAE